MEFIFIMIIQRTFIVKEVVMKCRFKDLNPFPDNPDITQLLYFLHTDPQRKRFVNDVDAVKRAIKEHFEDKLSAYLLRDIVTH